MAIRNITNETIRPISTVTQTKPLLNLTDVNTDLVAEKETFLSKYKMPLIIGGLLLITFIIKKK